MKNNKTCDMKGCVKKYLFSALVVFVFLFVAEFVINHIWLQPLYEYTSHLWRPKGQMADYFPLMFVYLGALSLILTALYFKCKKAQPEIKEGEKAPCPKKHGLCFGITIGLLLGVMHAAAYIWMPIPGELAIKWFISGLLEGVVSGLLLSCVCMRKDKATK
jgi:hypothetical protein